MKLLKRVAAFAAMLLVIVPLLAVGVYADASGEYTYDIWEYMPSKAGVLTELYGREQLSACYKALSYMERYMDSCPFFFAGAKGGYKYANVGLYNKNFTITSSRASDFGEGFYYKENVGWVVLYLDVYRQSFDYRDRKDSFNALKCKMELDVVFEGYSTIMFSDIQNSEEFSSISLVYAPGYTSGSAGQIHCNYSLVDIRVVRKDGTSYSHPNDDDSIGGFDLAILSMDGGVYNPSYLLSAFLTGPFGLAEGEEPAADVWYYPMQDIESLEYAFSHGFYHGATEWYDIGYEDGHEVGVYDGELSVMNTKNQYLDLIVGIFEAPGKLIDGMLGFEVFGLNVAGLVKTLLTLSVTAVVVYFVIKITKG